MPRASPVVIPLHPIAHTLAKLTGRNAKIRGRCVIPISELERRVTRKALIVWGAYAAFRDKDGTCWPSRETVAEVASDFFEEPVTKEEVRVALRGLKRVGLIRDIKWLPLKRYRKVYYREVRGRVFQRGLAWYVSVPDKVERLLSRANTRGGARPHTIGTGLKSADIRSLDTNSTGLKSAMSSAPLPPLPPLPPSRLLPSEEDVDRSAVEADLKDKAETDLLPSLGFLPPDSPAYAGLQYTPGSLGIPLRPTDAIAGPLIFQASKRRGNLARLLLLLRRYEHFGATLADLWYDDPSLEPRWIERTLSRLWRFVEKTGPRYVLKTRYRRAVIVPEARPFTKEELADYGKVIYRMRQAFEGAVRAVAGRKPSTFMRPVGAVAKLKMRELARRLSQMGASPESWFLFSANRWKGKGEMPVGHALSERRLIEQGGWFKSVRGGYACARVQRTGAERELNARYSRMLALLWHHLPQTPEGVKAIVDRCFPGDSWDRMIDKARREIEQEQARIDSRVASGEFVWVK